MKLLILSCLLLSGCGVTQWQRDQEARAAFAKMVIEANQDLNSKEMTEKMK